MSFTTTKVLIKDTKREQEEDWTGTYLQSEGQLPMSSAHSMNARKCVHSQKTTQLRHSRMNQTRSEEERQERQRLMERKAAQYNKNTSDELKRGLPSLGTVKVNNKNVQNEVFLVFFWINVVYFDVQNSNPISTFVGCNRKPQ